MQNRRSFIKNLSAAGAAVVIPEALASEFKPSMIGPKGYNDKIWGLLLHLSFNMFEEYSEPKKEFLKMIEPVKGYEEDWKVVEDVIRFRGYNPGLSISYKLWQDILQSMAAGGLNMVVIDLGNAILYESHPEIAVRKAWTVHHLREELDKIRKMGIEPIPKLNFSTAHDAWLVEYGRMVSTKKYYEICRDLIEEVIDLFDQPRYFHLGMDEETYSNQTTFDYAVIRQNTLWWGDFNFLIGEVEKNGSRPWIWSDYMWHHPDSFFKHMPKYVLQSNWYYDDRFSKDDKEVRGYLDLEKFDYDQIPTCSNYGHWDYKSKSGQENTMKTVKFCKKNIDEARLVGFLQTSWRPTTEEFRESIMDSIRQMKEAREWFYSF